MGLEYSQARSFNLGIALEVGVEAAIIYDDLAYAQQTFGTGKWFYRSYEQLINRLPFLKERNARTQVDKLVTAGWIEKKVFRQDGNPVCHYKICRFLSANFAGTNESANFAETYNDKETKKETKKDARFILAGNEVTAPGLLSELLQVVNPAEKATADRITQLNGRLKDYTPDELMAAARELAKSDWHRENKQMSIDNLIRASKIGRWHQAAADAAPALTNQQRYDYQDEIDNPDTPSERRRELRRILRADSADN